jgi:hypothetical protein
MLGGKRGDNMDPLDRIDKAAGKIPAALKHAKKMRGASGQELAWQEFKKAVREFEQAVKDYEDAEL